MSDKINAFFQILGRLGLHPTTVAAIAMLIVPVLALLTVYAFWKLIRSRKIVAQLGQRLGYEPPFDGEEIVQDVIGKETTLRDKETKIEQLEQQIAELQAEGNTKSGNLTALEQRAKELDEQLQQAAALNEKAKADASEQAQAHRMTLEQFELRMREIEGQRITEVTGLQQRQKELDEQLQQAALRNDKVTALANDHAQAHRNALEQFEQRTREVENQHNADLTALHRRTKDLENQLQQAATENDRLTAEAGERERAHQGVVAQLEQRVRDMEGESAENVAAVERRRKELEEQVNQAALQAALQDEKFAALAAEQERRHQGIVEQLEQRVRDAEAGGIANLAALQQRTKELEEDLERAALRNERITAQAGEQIQAYRVTIEQLEGRLRQNDAEGLANVAALQERSKELEERLHRASREVERVTAGAGEQAEAHGRFVEQMERRIREMEAEGSGKLIALQQRSRGLEDQLQQMVFQKEKATAEASELAETHQRFVEQQGQRIREMEAEGNGKLTALEQRSKELEDQLHQMAFQNEKTTSEASAQAETHQRIVEQLEARLREMESEGSASVVAFHQRSKELEELLQLASLKNEQIAAQAGEQAQVHWRVVEQLEQRIREMETERNASLSTLQQRTRELEEQLQQSEDQLTLVKADAAKRDVAKAETAGGSSEQFLRRAEWITACSVGAILPHGLVAAEAYTAAAMAANPKDKDAPQLMAELARIRRAYPQGLPSVIEAVTTFDEMATRFFATDVERAAEIAEDEAQRRNRAGLIRSALLVVNLALELRQQTDAEDSPGMLRLQELKAQLLARIGNNAGLAGTAPGFAAS
jgi:chromosome segregation ATPase